ncbi:efflux transporter outer membrane subunit [Rugamonas sp. DEMB1]|uniref:efflux transporter outer membrane subunit n=1 Tax=Rugamonas sp. DEMB1 TaxID=3039386 RepID=UPI00244D2CE2|nr:efflux transporter outer membrane subunit [Rugamonas sp. DEMB1]WGG51464.1 efflux transporter outer membrane subunit [Rugamonas sp. DEMB1]
MTRPRTAGLRSSGLRATALLAAAGALSACASQATPPQVAALAPPQWQAPLPHNGSVADLNDWWRRQDDALLVQLIDAAQQVSPTLATAAARIAQARAERAASGAALAPTLDGAASVGRSSQQSAVPLGTTSQAALQASWEIDLFGAGRAARDAAQARLDGAGAGWHDARVSVAAEVANQYYGQRACEQLLAVARQDAASRADTARLTGLSAKAGFQSPASAALARASAADGSSRATAQRASCDLGVKALVALSGIAEPELRQRLADGAPRWAAASAAANAATPGGGAGPALAITALPAQTLAQRPDVFNAEREVAAASAEVDGAQAQRYPRLSLSGAVGVANFRSDGQNTKGDTWSIGPLALSLPIFDGGRRRANVVAAAARYDSAVAAYRASVRQAVREVEEALVKLDSSGARAGDAKTALDGYRANFAAVEERYKNGLASLFELEDARRSRLAAEDTVVSLQRERSSAWVALYRAAGGGWNPAQTPIPTSSTAAATAAAR